MKRDEFIKKLEELDRLLMEEVETDELSDRARGHAHFCIEDAIDHLKENADEEGW